MAHQLQLCLAGLYAISKRHGRNRICARRLSRRHTGTDEYQRRQQRKIDSQQSHSSLLSFRQIRLAWPAFSVHRN